MLGVNELTQLSNSAWEMEQAVRCQPEPWRSRSGQPRRVWRRCVPVCLRPPSPEVSPQRTRRNEAGPPAAPARLFGSGNSEGQRSHEQRGTAALATSQLCLCIRMASPVRFLPPPILSGTGSQARAGTLRLSLVWSTPAPAARPAPYAPVKTS